VLSLKFVGNIDVGEEASPTILSQKKNVRTKVSSHFSSYLVPNIWHTEQTTRNRHSALGQYWRIQQLQKNHLLCKKQLSLFANLKNF